MSNPWNLTKQQEQAISALVETGCQKLAADKIGVRKTRMSVIVSQASERMGKRNGLLAAIEWDRWARAQ